MLNTKYIGMDIHKETISIAVMNAAGKVVMECVIETKANTVLQFIHGLRGDLHVTFEEGTWAAWLYDLLKPHVTEVLVCDPRKNALLKQGSKSDKIDARKLAELLRLNHLKPVYHGEYGVRTLKELARSYLTITQDLTRVRNRLKALYRSWAIPCSGRQVYALRHRSEWLGKISEAGVRWRAEHYYQQLDALRPLPGGAARPVDRGPETQGVETATPDPRDRCDPGNAVDRADPNTPQVPHQATTMELQRSGVRNV